MDAMLVALLALVIAICATGIAVGLVMAWTFLRELSDHARRGGADRR